MRESCLNILIDVKLEDKHTYAGKMDCLNSGGKQIDMVSQAIYAAVICS